MGKNKKNASGNSTPELVNKVQYNPVQDLSADSPLRQQGNLTGFPRKLKDLTADWYNARDKWNNLTIKGFNICNEIGNIKVEKFDEGINLPDSLLPLCDDLQLVISSMEALVCKMKRWTDSVLSIQQLLTEQATETLVIFQTWTIERFVKTAKELLDMYKKELSCKRSVYENICHSTNRQEVLFMLATWNHQPYLDDITLLQIDAMTIETGYEKT